MATGLVGRLQTLMGLAGVIALGVSASLVTGINPLDYTDDFLSAARDKLRGKLADPEPRWSERVDGRPLAAAVAGDRVIVMINGGVEARRLSDGGQAWTRTADWAVATGGVVVAGRATGPGYEVLDATTGRVRWSDTAARQAWPYQDLVLALTCDKKGNGCRLRARELSGGGTRWAVSIDAAAQRLTGYLELDELRERDGMIPPDHPGGVPRLVGLVGDGQVTVVDTRSGNVPGRVPEAADTRVVAAGDRLLGVTASATESGCRFAVRAWNPSGSEVWRRDGYDFGTVSGSGCEQREDPLVAGRVVAAVSPEDRPALLDVPSGSVRWTGRAGSRVLAHDGRLAVVRAGDGRQISAVNAETGAILWHRDVTRDAKARVLPGMVVIKESDRITVLSRAGGVIKSWKTQAALIGADAGGLILSNGRAVGYAPW